MYIILSIYPYPFQSLSSAQPVLFVGVKGLYIQKYKLIHLVRNNHHGEPCPSVILTMVTTPWSVIIAMLHNTMHLLERTVLFNVPVSVRNAFRGGKGEGGKKNKQLNCVCE